MRELHCDFMKGYKKLNHMIKIIEGTDESSCYYLPHHGVYNPENSTKKFCVIFNDSNPIASGKS